MKDRNGGFGLSGVNACGDGEKEMGGCNKDLRSQMDKTSLDIGVRKRSIFRGFFLV